MDDVVLAERLLALKTRAPGIAVAIVDRDGVRARAAVGMADLARGVAASTHLSCPWFSMTKLVTVTAGIRLAERGILDLDQPVADHVPAMQALVPRPLAVQITARELMSHSAGLANPLPLSWVHPPAQAGPVLDRWVAELLHRHRRLRSAPGTRASYSNLGTLVLGALMQKLAQMPFEELIEREVLAPLRLERTGFAVADHDLVATGYHPRWNPLRFLLPRWVIGAPVGGFIALRPFLLDGAPYGGLLGPVDDAARFLRCHLRDGELDGVRLLSEANAQAMRRICVRGRSLDMGLGWFRRREHRTADPEFVEHLGGGAGFWNVMRLYSTRGVGVVVMGNTTRYDIDAVARLALE
jgi:CubicO group peptidase (beta-lactamase class C family)